MWSGGQPISQLMAQAIDRPDLISLAAGFVDTQTLPDVATREALDVLFSNEAQAREALQYGTTPGYGALREALLARHLAADHVSSAETGLAVDQMVVTAGSNQLLHLIGDTLLDPGDVVLCAAPSYFVFLGMLANLGARCVGVATDEQGMIPEALDERLHALSHMGELERVKAIYVTSYFDNPCSVSLAMKRRPRIVQIACRWSTATRIHVIEDTAYRELRYTGTDLPSLRAFDESGDTVIVAGTFSKAYSPGIRVGWGILPRDLVGPVCQQKGNVDFGSPNFAQYLMHRVLDQGLFDRHVAWLRESYRQKLDAMLDAADRFLGPISGVHWILPEGGLYVWVSLPEEIDTGPSGSLLNQAVAKGVLYVPGQYCYPVEGPQHANTLRLSFGVPSVENIRKGVQLLSEAIGLGSTQ